MCTSQREWENCADGHMKEVPRVDADVRGQFRLCTQASGMDVYSTSMSQQKDKKVQVNFVIGRCNGNWWHSLPFKILSTMVIPHIFAFQFLVKDRQIPKWIFLDEVFEKPSFRSLFSLCGLYGKNHLHHLQWSPSVWESLSWSLRIKRIRLKWVQIVDHHSSERC